MPVQQGVFTYQPVKNVEILLSKEIYAMYVQHTLEHYLLKILAKRLETDIEP